MKKSQDKKKVLFVYYSFSSFIKNDLETLKKHFDVKTFRWRGKRDILKIAFNVLRSDITFSWFAADHAAVAVFFSKIFVLTSVHALTSYKSAREFRGNVMAIYSVFMNLSCVLNSISFRIDRQSLDSARVDLRR